MNPTVLRTAAWLAVNVLGLEPVAAKPDAESTNRTRVAEAFERWARP